MRLHSPLCLPTMPGGTLMTSCFAPKFWAAASRAPKSAVASRQSAKRRTIRCRIGGLAVPRPSRGPPAYRPDGAANEAVWWTSCAFPRGRAGLGQFAEHGRGVHERGAGEVEEAGLDPDVPAAPVSDLALGDEDRPDDRLRVSRPQGCGGEPSAGSRAGP